MKTFKVFLLAPLLLCCFLPTPVQTKPSISLPFKLHYPAHNINNPPPSRRREGFFAESPLTQVQRSFQDIQSNVALSMQSLLAAGSAIGQRMLGMMTRDPRLINTQQIRYPQYPPPQPPSHPSYQAYQPPPQIVLHQVEQQHYHDVEYEAPKFKPYIPIPVESNSHIFNEINYDLPQAPYTETYGSPAAPIVESYGSPETQQAPVIQTVEIISDTVYSPPATPSEYSYETPLTPSIQQQHSVQSSGLSTEDHTSEVFNNSVNTLDHSNDLSDEPVIHPGGSQDIDIHKVEVLGAASVVQAASATVPDQSHPEKYLNYDSNLLEDVVQHNLWYKQTKQLKHHKHGHKLKVIPHLKQI